MIKKVVISLALLPLLQAPAWSQTEKPLSRVEKPWSAHLDVGLPRVGPGVYYAVHPQWSLGAHAFTFPPLGFSSASVSARYYLSPENLSFYLEPTFGFSFSERALGGTSRPPSLGGTITPPVPETLAFAAIELGLEYRFDFGLTLQASGGAGFNFSQLIIAFDPQSFPALSVGAGWAF